MQPDLAQSQRGPEAAVQSWLNLVDYAGLLDLSAQAPRIPVIERFDWQGRAIETGFRRVRVMGRQVYALSEAAIGGNAEAGELAFAAYRALARHGIGDDGQFHCRLAPDGSPIDASGDVYDIAFGLFAMAWWYRCSGDPQALDLAAASVRQLCVTLRSASGRGFAARTGHGPGHCQNPHMHLFEAAIALASVSDREIFRVLADEMFALTADTLIDHASGTLPEFFDAQWRPTGHGGPVLVEPGHHYEWVWLLHRYAALAAQDRALVLADRLFAFALRHGHADSGLVLDGLDVAGRVIRHDLRIWPNTEFLKAQIVMQERHGTGPGFDDDAIAANVARIMACFLSPAAHGPAAALRAGLWIDYLQKDGLTPNCDHVPASTLYHIVCAFSEMLRHRQDRAGCRTYDLQIQQPRHAAISKTGR